MISSNCFIICSSDMVYLCIGRFYGVALSAMMATTAMQLAIDALDLYLIMQVELLK
jgi:hypothetical protein